MRTLRRAAEILGGIDQLRIYLRASRRQLAAWMQGGEKLPLDLFLKIVDLILEHGSPSIPGTQRIRVGPHTARCHACDGIDFKLLDPSAPVTNMSVLVCIHCKQQATRGSLVVAAADEGAKRSAAWINRTQDLRSELKAKLDSKEQD